MEYTIQELRAFHKLSKPELEKVEVIVNRTTMDKGTRHIVTSLLSACESYDEVIDQLFEEIDRLNGQK